MFFFLAILSPKSTVPQPSAGTTVPQPLRPPPTTPTHRFNLEEEIMSPDSDEEEAMVQVRLNARRQLFGTG